MDIKDRIVFDSHFDYTAPTAEEKAASDLPWAKPKSSVYSPCDLPAESFWTLQWSHLSLQWYHPCHILRVLRWFFPSAFLSIFLLNFGLHALPFLLDIHLGSNFTRYAIYNFKLRYDPTHRLKEFWWLVRDWSVEKDSAKFSSLVNMETCTSIEGRNFTNRLGFVRFWESSAFLLVCVNSGLWPSPNPLSDYNKQAPSAT